MRIINANIRQYVQLFLIESLCVCVPTIYVDDRQQGVRVFSQKVLCLDC